MRSLSGRLKWGLFLLTILLLTVVAFQADRATNLFADSSQWVSHTHEVETELEKIEADLLAIESGRQGYILSGSSSHEERYQAAKVSIGKHLAKVNALTIDNPPQQQRLNKLEPLIERRIALLEESIALRKEGKPDRSRQIELTTAGLGVYNDAVSLLEDLKKEEARLLVERQQLNGRRYNTTRQVLAIAFLVVVLLLFANFRQLLIELKDRERAESAVRRLSSRILQLQDAERRKVARELHDSIGQYFAGLKMDLGLLRNENLSEEKRRQILERSTALLDKGLAETRTLSHLLHPPMLDEIGFASAASWYVEGFSERSKIDVTLELPNNMKRLPRDMELVLFRVLQEALTNIHKHSGSGTALVRLDSTEDAVRLLIQDHGRGIPPLLLQEFQRTSSGTGVGLAGMRERVIESRGKLEVQSDAQGTCLLVTMPLPPAEESISPNSSPEFGRGDSDVKTDRMAKPGDRNGLMLARA
ncbi:MAG TPA: CHASE3 domain-containing protein [Terriglobales bacterium]|jgi:signal transduction histidine kinase